MITIKRNRPVLFASLSAMLMVVTGCVNQELTGSAVAQEKNITTADKMIRWEHGLPDFAAKITDGGKGGDSEGGKGDDGGGNATSVVPVGGEGDFAKKDSPALTGTPTAPTPAVRW